MTSNMYCRNQPRRMDCACPRSTPHPAARPDRRPCCSAQPRCLTNTMHATEQMPVGMTYTPYQEFVHLYEPDTALCRGTIFCDLDKPFLMTNCAQGGTRL